jgi:hypothetical protein
MSPMVPLVMSRPAFLFSVSDLVGEVLDDFRRIVASVVGDGAWESLESGGKGQNCDGLACP